MSFGGADHDLRSAPPVLAPEAPSPERGEISSDDVAVLFDPVSGHSMLAGAVTARDFLTQTLVDAPARSLRVRCLADGVPLAPGETAWSECVTVDVVGGPIEQLARYGGALGRLMHARVPAQTPAGWCSWYYFYTQVTEDDVLRNLRFLERHRRELPVQTVQIDDGYQADIGDWLTVNEKFPHGMAWLASEIRSAGYTPGIWLAPLLLAETSRTYAEHPGWIIRDGHGAPVITMQNWQRNSFGLDGSHPEARAWLRDLFREVCEGWGYDYVKIDFLFAGAVAGRRHDPTATRARAYRAAREAIREAVGPDRFILGCGALMAPSVGVFDGNRIGPDVAPFWRNLTHEERQRPRPRARRPDDDLSAETAIRNTLNRWWMHGRLWANDPDCLLVRTDRTKLTRDETRTLASAIGLTGGMMLSSDDLASVPADGIEIASMLLPPLPRSAVPADLMERDMPERLNVELDGAGPAHIIGLFNFEDEARDVAAPLPPGRWHAVELWDQRPVGTLEGQVAFALVAPHACRVIALAPATDMPMLVATTAHIGMGTLDVLESGFDRRTGILRARLAPVGRAQRRIVLSHAGSLEAASVDGDPCDVHAAGDLSYIDITVGRECVLEVTYRLDSQARAG
jgi:alpha-galactosidase